MRGFDLQTGKCLDDEGATIPAYLTEPRWQYHPAVTPDLSGDAVAAGQGRTGQRIPSLTALLVVPALVAPHRITAPPDISR